MTRKPDFIILAGPNCAGKSTNGHFYVPVSTPIFNGDLVLADLIKKYPTIEPDHLHGGVAKALEDARDAALAEKKDFRNCFQWKTNLYRMRDIVNTDCTLSKMKGSQRLLQV